MRPAKTSAIVSSFLNFFVLLGPEDNPPISYHLNNKSVIVCRYNKCI